MASRGNRGGSKRARIGSVSSRVPQIPGFEEVIFAHHTQHGRFSNLKGMPINPTRFLSRDAMITLGLEGTMRNLFAGTGLSRFYGMQERTYRSLTLEFLSSLKMDDDTHELTFRIENEGYTMSLADFGNHFGLERSPLLRAPEGFSGHELWNCLSTTTVSTFTNVRVNAIQHPAIRIWFRTVIGTIFGRGEVGTLNFTELSILGGFLNVHRGGRFALDLPYLLVRHMLDVAECRIKSIEIGGLVTFLVKAMGFDCGNLTPIDRGDRWIDCDYLRASHHWLVRVNRGYKWRVTSKPNDRYIDLPSNILPALYTLSADDGQGPPSYLIPEEGNQRIVQTEGRQRPRRPQATQEEGTSSNPPPSHHEIYMNQWHFMNERFTHHAVNQNLSTYWQYHNEVESGVAQGPHPTYYRGADTSGVFEEAGINQNAWNQEYHRSYGGFGGQFLDEFGRLNVGGNGGGGDDGHDDLRDPDSE